MNAQTRWSEKHTKQLQELFKKNEADPNNCKKDHIHSVHEKHFNSFAIKNFTAVYKRKAQQFLIDASLKGARSKGMFVTPSLCTGIHYAI